MAVNMLKTGTKKYLIIGISGVTSGGKTSLCDKLQKLWGSAAQVMCMDDYFFPDEHPSHIRLPEFNGHANWEALESVDFKKMHNDVLKWVENTSKETDEQFSVLLVEGIIIFNYKPLIPLFDKKFFFTLTKEQCWERRKFRVYEPPDPEGYYDGVVWPMYVKNKEALQDVKDITFIDGTKDQETIFQSVMDEIKTVVIFKK